MAGICLDEKLWSAERGAETENNIFSSSTELEMFSKQKHRFTRFHAMIQDCAGGQKRVLEYILANGSSLLIRTDFLFYFSPQVAGFDCGIRRLFSKLRIGSDVQRRISITMHVRRNNPIFQDIYWVS